MSTRNRIRVLYTPDDPVFGRFVFIANFTPMIQYFNKCVFPLSGPTLKRHWLNVSLWAVLHVTASSVMWRWRHDVRHVTCLWGVLLAVLLWSPWQRHQWRSDDVTSCAASIIRIVHLLFRAMRILPVIGIFPGIFHINWHYTCILSVITSRYVAPFASIITCTTSVFFQLYFLTLWARGSSLVVRIWRLKSPHWNC